jgi:hypothetical protein
MSSFPTDRAMEAICFFEPRNGSVFPYRPVAERLCSLRWFDASHVASTPCPRWTAFNSRSPEQQIDDAGGRTASDVARREGLADLAGHDRHAPGRPSRAVTTHRAVLIHRADAFGPTLLARCGRAQGSGNQSMIGTCWGCDRILSKGSTRRCADPGLQSASDPTSANRCTRPAAR